jgi:hypothetical protein
VKSSLVGTGDGRVYADPDVKTQTVLGGTSSGRVFADTLPRIPLRLTTWTANIIIRSPSMSEVFQPYGGMGYGMFFATSSKNGTSNVHVSPGLSLLAGARYVLTPPIGRSLASSNSIMRPCALAMFAELLHAALRLWPDVAFREVSRRAHWTLGRRPDSKHS